MSRVVKLFPQSSPPPAEHCAPWSAAHDRAHVVAGAIIQIIQQALLRSLFDDDPTGLTTARPEIEALLCDEFSDVAHTTLNEIRREEG